MLMRVVSVDSWGQTKALKREWEEDFPGGPGVESPPATAEDMGSFPGLRRSHMPRSNQACAPQLLSPHSRGHMLQLLHLEPMNMPTRGAAAGRSLSSTTNSSPLSRQAEKDCAATKTQCSHTGIKFKRRERMGGDKLENETMYNSVQEVFCKGIIYHQGELITTEQGTQEMAEVCQQVLVELLSQLFPFPHELGDKATIRKTVRPGEQLWHLRRDEKV